MIKFDLLLKEFERKKVCTTNEAIDEIYKRDLKKGPKFMLKRGWRFYVHLNKQTAVIERCGHIREVGTKVGVTGKPEKVWEYLG